jgi:hypothetical protein
MVNSRLSFKDRRSGTTGESDQATGALTNHGWPESQQLGDGRLGNPREPELVYQPTVVADTFHKIVQLQAVHIHHQSYKGTQA